MNKTLSTYLDLVRFCAALAVLFFHLTYLGIDYLYISRHGAEAVSVFFVLSGFLMRYTTRHRETAFGSYAEARVARVLPVSVLCLLVTYGVDFVGRSADVAVYQAIPFYNQPTIRLFLINVLFVNKIWFTNSIFGSNGPFWSLGFEIPYYILFAILVFARGWVRAGLGLLWAILYGPKILCFFPLWYLGVVCYDMCGRSRSVLRNARGRVGLAMCLAGCLGYLYLRTLGNAVISMSAVESAAQIFTSLAYFFGVGVLFAVSVVGIDLLSDRLQPLAQAIHRPVQWLAGGTFTLYLVHAPLIIMTRAVFGPRSFSRWDGVLIAGAIIAASLLLAECAERRKRLFRRSLGLVLDRRATAVPTGS